MLLATPPMDVHLSQATFRVLLSSLAEPGRRFQLPRVADGPSALPLALADLDTPVAVVGDDDRARAVAAATGAPLVELEEALLVAFWRPPCVEEVGRLPVGSALAPERGAKVAIAVDWIGGARSADTAPRLAPRTALVLSGPGVDGEIALSVGGLVPEVFAALRQRNANFPAGVDTWLVDRAGAVAAISRSSAIEVG